MSHTVPTDDLPRPSPPRRWSGTVVAALLMAALLMTAMVVVSLAAMNRPPAATSRGVLDRARTAGSGGDWPATTGGNATLDQQFGRAQHLTAATAPPAPAPPALQTAPPLQTHEVFGFAPSWTLPEAGGFDVGGLTTIAYFSLDVNPDGSIARSGPGWAGFRSQDLAALVTRAHRAGDRVVLTVTCFDQNSLDQLTADPTAAATLATQLVPLLHRDNLDGVNIDFEGRGGADRSGLVRLVTALSSALRAADPHWQVTLDSYASSASDPDGFFDIAGLAPAVDAFFVMGYDMGSLSAPSPTAPLAGGSGDAAAVAQYRAVVPASKILLGMPFYGYDWPTTGPGRGAAATGAPTPVADASILARGGPRYWDSATQTVWSAYRSGSQWHQVWFDDPTSLALKAHLAAADGIRGVGIWALGMGGNDPALLAAVHGAAPAATYQLAPPSSPAPSSPASSSSPPSSTTPSSATPLSTTPSRTAPSTSGRSGAGSTSTAPAGGTSSTTTTQPGSTTTQPGSTTTQPGSTTSQPGSTTTSPASGSSSPVSLPLGGIGP